MRVRHAVPPDSWAWLEMRNDLWPGHENKWHAEEINQFFSGMLKMPLAVLVAEDESGELVGFVELNIRPYAEECLTDRVAFLEGWYVKPHARQKGVGKALVEASWEWGRAQGCTEFGSDAELDNEVSQKAHIALGFEEVGQLRCFKKPLA
jgi:aminoglycoside 6'-N-acetyltransferase I